MPDTSSPLDLSAAELKQVTQTIYEKNAELVKLDRTKDEFVSLTSHELRTPLTIIKNYLWLAANRPDVPLGPLTDKYIHTAIHSVDRLMDLVEDMLTVSRIHSGHFVLKKQEIDIVQLMRTIWEEYSIKAQEKSLVFSFHSGLPECKLSVDQSRLQQVFINILGNALKFTPEKGTVAITLEKKNGQVRITVTDTGPGIPSEKQSILFTKFGKIDESYNNLPAISGTGLGLYISQQIMKLHDGDIEVQSVYGKGSAFTMLLPI